MRNPATMQAYWVDYRLLLGRVAASAGSHLVVIHVEPDLWVISSRVTLSAWRARLLIA